MSFSKIRFNVKKEAGFTLVELLIVIAIIAILAAIAIPAFNRYIAYTKILTLKNDLRNAYIAAQDYLINNNSNFVDDGNKLYNYGFKKTQGIDILSVNISVNSGSITLIHNGLDTNIVDTNVGIVNYKQEYFLPKLK